MEGSDSNFFEEILADISAGFINLPAERVDDAIEQAQKRICEFQGYDISTIWQWTQDNSGEMILTHLYRPGAGPPHPERMNGAEYFPVILAKLIKGETSVVNSTEKLSRMPIDRETYMHYEVKSSTTFPLILPNQTIAGVLSFNMTREEREWAPGELRRLRLVADIFANAICRKHIETELRDSQIRMNLAIESAGAGLWSLNLETRFFWLTEKTRELFCFGLDEEVSFDRFIQLVEPEDRSMLHEMIQKLMDTKREQRCDYRVNVPGKGLRWMASMGRLREANKQDGAASLTGITIDNTAAKESEARLEAALKEVEILRSRLEKENEYLRKQVRLEAGQTVIVGESEPVKRVLNLISKVGPTDSAVLILGETGTGKELLADAVHQCSHRRDRTMIKVNCAALPASLIESELFGRDKGAYTGAMTQRPGRFEIANGSTLFLDEVGEMPLELQAKLLRVLETGIFERLGSSESIQTDVRIVAASNRDLQKFVQEGKFREDLYHRLNVFPVTSVPLRERVSDIPLLAWHFIKNFNTKMGRSVDTVPKAVMEKLKVYPWPGNVRELKNVIERAMILCDSNVLEVELNPSASSPGAESLTLEAMERAHILKILIRTGWRVSGKGGAAERLSIQPTTLHSRMKKLGIQRPETF